MSWTASSLGTCTETAESLVLILLVAWGIYNSFKRCTLHLHELTVVWKFKDSCRSGWTPTRSQKPVRYVKKTSDFNQRREKVIFPASAAISYRNSNWSFFIRTSNKAALQAFLRMPAGRTGVEAGLTSLGWSFSEKLNGSEKEQPSLRDEALTCGVWGTLSPSWRQSKSRQSHVTDLEVLR